MDRQYNDQRKHGQTRQRPKETWTFGRCIACPFFFWSLYCLSMLPLVVVLPVHVSFGRCINTTTKRNMDRQYKTKRNMDRQYNDQKKHGQTIQRPKETWTDPCFLWSLYCLSMFLLVVVLSVHVSFGSSIAGPCFLWSFYCLSMFLLVVVLSVHASNDQKKHGQTIQQPKETWTGNTTTKRNMDRQYNDQKKHFSRCIVCPCFFWSLYYLSMFLLVVVFSVHVSFGRYIVCPCFFWKL
jgi:heme exporter protein D